MEYQSDNATVTYHSDKPTGPTAGSETLDVLEFVARVASHIPNRGQVLQRYYGWYASRTRGIRRRAGTAGQQTVYAASVPVPLREARRRWAELLRRIFEVEPLECPRCGQAMRIVAFITEPQVIDRIVEYLRRNAAARCRSRAPPRAARRAHAAAGSTSA